MHTTINYSSTSQASEHTQYRVYPNSLKLVSTTHSHSFTIQRRCIETHTLIVPGKAVEASMATSSSSTSSPLSPTTSSTKTHLSRWSSKTDPLLPYRHPSRQNQNACSSSTKNNQRPPSKTTLTFSTSPPSAPRAQTKKRHSVHTASKIAQSGSRWRRRTNSATSCPYCTSERRSVA